MVNPIKLFLINLIFIFNIYYYYYFLLIINYIYIIIFIYKKKVLKQKQQKQQKLNQTQRVLIQIMKKFLLLKVILVLHLFQVISMLKDLKLLMKMMNPLELLVLTGKIK